MSRKAFKQTSQLDSESWRMFSGIRNFTNQIRNKRNLGNVLFLDGIRIWPLLWKGDLPKSLHAMRHWEKNGIGIEMTEVRDTGGSQNTESGPNPPPAPTNTRFQSLSILSCFWFLVTDYTKHLSNALSKWLHVFAQSYRPKQWQHHKGWNPAIRRKFGAYNLLPLQWSSFLNRIRLKNNSPAPGPRSRKLHAVCITWSNAR